MKPHLLLFLFLLAAAQQGAGQTNYFKLTDTVFNVGDVYIARGIYFEFDRGQPIRKESIPALDSIVDFMKKNRKVKIEVGVYTDSKGALAYNNDFSKRRADYVRRLIIEKGISEKRLKAVGYGEANPIAPNENTDGTDNPDGRALNRRIELKILKAE